MSIAVATKSVLTAAPPADHPAYRPDIDGLRAVAVLSVLVYHAFPSVLRGGFTGVDIFFVISGFLICSIILKGLDRGTFSFADFYARRIRRIFPALLLVVGISLIVGWFVLLPDEFEQLGKHAVAAAAFGANFAFNAEAGYFDIAGELKPFLHLWSLGIEEQFYILMPLTLFLFRRQRNGTLWLLLGLGLASFAASVILIRTDPAGAFYLPFTRAWELMVGASLAWLTLYPDNPLSQALAVVTGGRFAAWRATRLSREIEAAAGFALIFAAVIGLRANASFPGWGALLPVYGAALVIAAGPGALLNRLILGNRAVVYIGLISYPLYLWHWPLLSFVRIAGLEEPSPAVRIGLLAAAFVCAALTYHFIEKPIRRHATTRAVWRLAIASIAVAALGATTWVMRGFDERFARYRELATAQTVEEPAKKTGPRCHYNEGDQSWETFEKGLPRCLALNADRPNILVFGDSHAANTRAALASAYPGIHFLQATGPGCIPATQFRNTQMCAVLVKRVKEHISDFGKLDGIVLTARWDSGFRAVLPEMDFYRARKIPVIVFGPTFEFTADARKVYYRLAGDLDRIKNYVVPSPFEIDEQMDRFLSEQHVPYVSKIKTLCGEGDCPIVDARGRVLYSDSNHWSARGLTVFGQMFKKHRVIETGLGISERAATTDAAHKG